MRRALAAGLAAGLLVLAGCDAVSPPGESRVDVDTPELRAQKADAGIETCEPGAAEPGAGDLPDVTLACLGGGPDVDLSTLTGPLVINFWASWCGPCRQEMPVVQEFYETYGDQVPVLGVDYSDTQPGAALELAATSKVTYPLLADPGEEIAAQGDLSVRGLPQFVLIDAEGRMVLQKAVEAKSVQDVVDLVDQHLGIDLAAGR